MNEGPSITKPVDVLKSEHLTSGIKPIMACVGSFGDFGPIERASIEEKFNEQLSDVHNVDYYGNQPSLEEHDFLNAGEKTYVISTVDEFNKFSENLLDCTGLVVAGIDKQTGKNISFLSHQDPEKILSQEKDNFIIHLEQRLFEIKEKCKPGTVDAIVIGGNYLTKIFSSMFKQNYLGSIELLSLIIKKILGFEPIVINGPKMEGGYDNIYYDNQDKRLYFMRQKVNPNTGSFTNSGIEKTKKKWENGSTKK